MTTHTDIPHASLPLWMRRAQRGVDWGVLFVLVLSLVAAWPFLIQSGLPRTNDTERYVFRTADTVEALREGQLYPRWSPHVQGGYGAPIANYYPPGAPYSAAVVAFLFTNNSVLAIRIIYIVSFCLAGSLTYVVVTRHVNAAAGVVAAMLYLFSPYVGLIAPHIIGDLPGVMTLGLIPTLLWAVGRLCVLNQPLDVAIVGLTTTGLILTEPRAAVVGIFLAIAMVGWYQRASARTGTWVNIMLALLIGVGLSAFYWIPAYFESNLVQWVSIPPGSATLEMVLPAVFSLPIQVDSLALIPSVPLTFGVTAPALAVIYLLICIRMRDGFNFHILFILLGIILLFVGILILPTQVWLMGPIALCFAIGGSGILQLRHRYSTEIQRLILSGLMIVIIISAVPVWLAPRWSPTFGTTTPLDQILFEQQDFGIAILPNHAPLPTTIATDLPHNNFLLRGYQENAVNRLALDRSTAIRLGSVLEHTGHSDRFQIRTASAMTLDLPLAYFPGWEAYVNGSPIPLRPNPDTGLIQIDVPSLPRSGTLTLYFGTTPTRTLSWLVTWITLAIIVLHTSRRLNRLKISYDDLALLTIAEARLVGLIVVCFIVVISLFATPFSPASLRTPPGSQLQDTIALNSRTNVGLEVVAYRLPQTTLHPGDTLNMTLYWISLLPALTQNYQVQAFLRTADTEIRWFQTETHPPGLYPTRRWLTRLYVADTHAITISDTAVPGEYQIAIELMTCNPECTPNTRATFADTTGTPVGAVLILPTTVQIAP